MRIFLDPLETLHFRNGRPFNAGEVGYAETIFPPTPETMQGVVRALIASYWDPTRSMEEIFQKDSDLVKLIGNSSSYGRLHITDIALVRWTGDNPEPLYPVPAHILREEKTKKLFLLKPDTLHGVISNMPSPTQYFLTHEKPKYKLESTTGWLTEIHLRQALQAETDDALQGIKIIKDNDIFEREFRVGIGIDNSRKAAEEGLLYSTQMIRMKEKYYPSIERYGFRVEMYIAQETAPDKECQKDTQRIHEALHKNDGRWITMGGERRAVRFKVPDRVNPSDTSTKKGSLLYLATPAAFSDGWKPDKLPKDPIAAAVSRYQSIGGWQLESGKSGSGSNKKMRRCVPAGSVYFFDQEIEIPPCIGSDTTTQIGYGIARTGVWK
jgi:CRISPR-associated protein Cmr3